MSCQNLDVYQRAIEFLSFSRTLLVRVQPGHAGLVEQLRRAAHAIPMNIAEGSGRVSRADKLQYYTTARGSAIESAAHLDMMFVDGLITKTDYGQGIELLERVVGTLTRMIKP